MRAPAKRLGQNGSTSTEAALRMVAILSPVISQSSSFKMRAAYVQASSEVISEICFTIDSEIDRLGSFGRVNHDFVDSITYFAGGVE